MGSPRNIKDILDSDDELPLTYKDLSVTPAYQNDNRFSEKAIYLLTKDDEDLSDCSSDLSSEQGNSYEQELETLKTDETKPVILREGMLSRKDAYCIKVFGTFFNDETLLWFINFTISKNMLSNFSFLTSCLACNDQDYKPYDESAKNYIRQSKDCNKKIVFEYK